jgi:bifunctional non-homologous end joining protein LigD
VTQEREVHGRRIAFSNLEKLMYPDAGIRKGDVVDYYERIAPVMLPHVRDRFLSMHRWPDGIEGRDFYQKDAPDHFPDWIRTEEVEKRDGVNWQVVVDEPATLVYLAQQACLTPHVGTSRADRPRRPDRLVFDFDPPEASWQARFDGVRRAATALRELLGELSLDAFVMTSGSRGLHVHVPLQRRADFAEAKAFGRDVSRLLATRHADRLTVEQRKRKRGDRIFIDYLRNDYGQTAVAPYALRARPGAPVATPLAWDELSRAGMGPRRYTLRNLFRRLAGRGDPWAGMDARAGRLDGARRRALDERISETRPAR